MMRSPVVVGGGGMWAAHNEECPGRSQAHSAPALG